MPVTTGHEANREMNFSASVRVGVAVKVKPHGDFPVHGGERVSRDHVLGDLSEHPAGAGEDDGPDGQVEPEESGRRQARLEESDLGREPVAKNGDPRMGGKFRPSVPYIGFVAHEPPPEPGDRRDRRKDADQDHGAAGGSLSVGMPAR